MSIKDDLERADREVAGVRSGIAKMLLRRSFSPTEAARWVAKLRRAADIIERIQDGK